MLLHLSLAVLPLAFASTFHLTPSLPAATAPLSSCIILASLQVAPSPSIHSLTPVCPAGTGVKFPTDHSKSISISFDSLSAEDAGKTTIALYARLMEDSIAKKFSAGCMMVLPKFTADYIDGRNLSLREYAADKKLVLWDDTLGGPLSDPKTFQAIECVTEPEAILPKGGWLPSPDSVDPSDKVWSTAIDLANTPEMNRNVTLSAEWVSHIVDPPLVFSPPADPLATYQSPPFNPDPDAAPSSPLALTTSIVTTTINGQATVTPVVTVVTAAKESTSMAVLINKPVESRSATKTEEGVMSILPILPYPSPAAMSLSASSASSNATASSASPSSSSPPASPSAATSTVMPVLLATGSASGGASTVNTATVTSTVTETVREIGTITEVRTVMVTATMTTEMANAPSGMRRRLVKARESRVLAA